MAIMRRQFIKRNRFLLCVTFGMLSLIGFLISNLYRINTNNNYMDTTNNNVIITGKLVYFNEDHDQQQQNSSDLIVNKEMPLPLHFTTSSVIISSNTKRIPKPFKKDPNFKGCYSSIGTLEAKVKNHDVGEFDFYYPFEPTLGWIDNISYHFESNQSYPYLLNEFEKSRNNDKDQNQKQGQGPCNIKKPTKLVGFMASKKFNIIKEPADFDEIVQNNPEVNVGGEWVPPRIPAGDDDTLSPTCPKVAIIIPYRDRESHLKILLNVLHPMLQRQQIHYQMFVAEQFGENTFNRGIMKNAAFVAVMKLDKFNCVIFHDVDMIPENDYNLYNCDQSPRHFAVAIDKFNYKLPYKRVFGGVVGMTPEHFIQINGYPNTYWGWGGEDDDLYFRTEALHLNINRYPNNKTGIPRYKMLSHSDEKRRATEFVCELLRTARTRYPIDGITTLQFTLLSIAYEELYTHLLIDVGLPDKIHYD